MTSKFKGHAKNLRNLVSCLKIILNIFFYIYSHSSYFTFFLQSNQDFSKYYLYIYWLGILVIIVTPFEHYALYKGTLHAFTL